MTNLKKYGILLLLILTALLCSAQDPQFSRFYSNSLYMAPSFAGITGFNRLSLSYRNQWTAITNGYVTYTASIDHNFAKLNSGVGVLFLRDEAGTGKLSNTQISILYAYDFKITPWLHVRPGLNFSYMERSLDYNRLLWMDQMSASGDAPSSAEVVSLDKTGDLDFNSSLLVYHEQFWMGFSVDHLLKPNQSLYYQEFNEDNFAKVPIKYQFFGGYKYVVREQLLRPIPTILQIAYLYKQQAEYQQLDLGFYWYYNPLVMGVWYRGIPMIGYGNTNDAVVLLVGLKTSNLNIGYSYDFTTSKLITNSGGSHEVSVSFTFNKPEGFGKKRYRKMVPCPEF